MKRHVCYCNELETMKLVVALICYSDFYTCVHCAWQRFVWFWKHLHNITTAHSSYDIKLCILMPAQIYTAILYSNELIEQHKEML